MYGSAWYCNASKTDSVVPVAKNVDMILNLTARGVK